MIRFLMNGLLRDRSRSMFPLLIVIAGVSLTVFAHTWIQGTYEDMIETTARLQSGHLKVMTRIYAQEQLQNPIDLALFEAEHWLSDLRRNYPSVQWQLRIHFGGLLDFPDEVGESMAQAPVTGIAIDLFSKDSREIELLRLKESLVRGRFPENPGEILVSDSFFEKLDLELGQTGTLLSSDMDGGLAVYNFTVVGTLTFGIKPLDRKAMLALVSDVQNALNMGDATTEIFGYFFKKRYQAVQGDRIRDHFNSRHGIADDPFSPFMITLKDQGEMGKTLEMIDIYSFVIVAVFLFVMVIVLWNTGLMSGIRRYGEIGVRLAMGETQKHIYFTLLGESLIVGITGSLIGTVLGLIPSYYFQEFGVDFSQIFSDTAGILISNVRHSQVTVVSYWIGFIPGVLATLLGTTISGLAIYKRQTAELFKELER